MESKKGFMRTYGIVYSEISLAQYMEETEDKNEFYREFRDIPVYNKCLHCPHKVIYKAEPKYFNRAGYVLYCCHPMYPKGREIRYPERFYANTDTVMFCPDHLFEVYMAYKCSECQKNKQYYKGGSII